MIKKLLSIFLAIALVLSMAACSGDHNMDPTVDPVIEPTNNSNTTEDSNADHDETEGTDVTGPDETTGTDNTENTEENTDPTEIEHVHVYDVTEIVDATCTDNGHSVYTCECGDSYEDDHVEALGHKWNEWTTIKEATENAEGKAERTCSVCDESESRTLAKLVPGHTHSYTSNITKNATCSSHGVMIYTCSCGDTYTESVEKTKHTYTDTVTAPTCTAGGYTTHSCKTCGYSYVDNKTNPVDHKWSEWKTTKEPTTIVTGTAERTCAKCGSKETKMLDKLIENHTHNYSGSITKASTCTAEGVKTYTCSCGSSYTEKIAKVGHNYRDDITAATCTKQGHTTHTCTTCGYSYSDSFTSALGHSYKDVIVQPTCEDKGYTRHTCSKCGNSYDDENKDALGHSYTSTVTSPTCTEDGYTTHVCGSCGNSYKDSHTDATGHINTKTETVEPNCLYSGYTQTTCNDCDTVVSKTIIPATGIHDYETQRLSDAVAESFSQGDYSYGIYANFKDWNVDVCKHCNYINIESMRFAYTDYEAAEIMLGYVNALRAEVYGTHDYDLVLDPKLIELANVRAVEISDNYSHFGGTYTNASENISEGKVNIYDYFVSWKNSSGHYKNMIEKTHKYFGFGLRKSTDCWSTSGTFGVQLFWCQADRDTYFQ